MIYTIGHTQTYTNALANAPESGLFKMGRTGPTEEHPDGYPGGYAFICIADAQRRIDEAYVGRGFSVFGLDAEWSNTVKAENGWWHHIIEDARIILLGE